MKWSDALRVLAINSLYELKNDRRCRCEDKIGDACWNCQTHAALELVAKKKIIPWSMLNSEVAIIKAKATSEHTTPSDGLRRPGDE